MLSETQYRDALSSVLIPANLIATSNEKSAGDEGDWRTDADRCLLDRHWRIRTEDPDKVRKPDKYIWFGEALDFGHGLYSGVTPLNDALTLRLVCLEILKGNATTKPVAAARTVKLMGLLEWVIRWRNAVGLHRLQDLTAEHYRQFTIDASTTDITDLVPLIDRLDVLAEDSDYRLPLYAHGKRYRMRWVDFAETLGVNRWNLGHSRKFREAFERRLPVFLEKSGVNIEDADLTVRETDGRVSKKADPSIRLGAWDCLERLSLKGLLSHDFLSFRPSQVDVKIEKQPGKRTKSLLPHDLLRLFRLSAIWVLEYAPYILACLRERRKVPKLNRHEYLASMAVLMEKMDASKPNGMPYISLGLGRNFTLRADRLDLSVALKYLFVAASILIGGFGGRRREETGSLQDDPLFTRNGITYLSIYIEKTLREIDAIPVPALVERAWLSYDGRWVMLSSTPLYRFTSIKNCSPISRGLERGKPSCLGGSGTFWLWVGSGCPRSLQTFS